MKVCVCVCLGPELMQAIFKLMLHWRVCKHLYPLFLALMISRHWQQCVATVQHNCPWATPHS